MTELEREIAHLKELQAKHRKNIRTLEETLASYGMDRPLKLVNELEFEQEQLRRVEARLEELATQAMPEQPCFSETLLSVRAQKVIRAKWRWGVMCAAACVIALLILVLVLKPSRVHCAASSYQGDLFYCWNCTCEKAWDGLPFTRWASAWNDDEWIVRDFGEQVAIDVVILKWEAAYGKAYTIDVSNDGMTWTSVYTETNGDGDTDVIHFPLTTARYIRMHGLVRGTSYGYSLWEFEVYRAASRY